jgi:hypothetical protein
MGVGTDPFVVSYTSKGISTPVPDPTNIDHIYALFEYTIDKDGVDVDVSNVDQVGFPFTIKTTPMPDAPGNFGVGIAQTRGDLFNLYNQYVTDHGANAAMFKMSVDSEQLRIMAPQNVVEYAPQAQVFQEAPTLSAGGGLAGSTTYNYWITATRGYSGETEPGNVQNIKTDPADTPGGRYTINLSWKPFEWATGYNVYRSLTNDPTTSQLIAKVKTTSFSDSTATYTPGKAPPTNNYLYYPQNNYFNNAINAFFSHYTPKDSFQIAVSIALSATTSKTYNLKGNTINNYAIKNSGNDEVHHYTVLALTGTDPDIVGQTFLLVRPYFRENMSNAAYPPAPDWMPHPDQGPGVMILANDGVFNTGGAQPGVNASVLSNLQNSIVSAFNRGIATQFNIKPNNWANAPLVTGAAVGNVAGGKLTPDNYYYVVTATNALGETTASLEVMGQIKKGDGNNSVSISWKADNSYTKYNIFRSLTPGSGYQLLETIANLNPTTQVPSTGYTDKGVSKLKPAITPAMYYAPGSTSNWYAGFLHQNQTINPTTGVSINGLAYGFGYDDQGNNSTNVQGPYTAIDIAIQDWSVSETPPVMFDPTPNIATSLAILRQPRNTVVGGTNSIGIQAFGPDGQRFIGGGEVEVELHGVASLGNLVTQKVRLDPVTGIGTLWFRSGTAGLSYLLVKNKAQIYRSKIFMTLTGSVDAATQQAINTQLQTLTQLGESIYQSIDQTAASLASMTSPLT